MGNLQTSKMTERFVKEYQPSESQIDATDCGGTTNTETKIDVKDTPQKVYYTKNMTLACESKTPETVIKIAKLGTPKYAVSLSYESFVEAYDTELQTFVTNDDMKTYQHLLYLAFVLTFPDERVSSYKMKNMEYEYDVKKRDCTYEFRPVYDLSLTGEELDEIKKQESDPEKQSILEDTLLWKKRAENRRTSEHDHKEHVSQIKQTEISIEKYAKKLEGIDEKTQPELHSYIQNLFDIKKVYLKILHCNRYVDGKDSEEYNELNNEIIPLRKQTQELLNACYVKSVKNVVHSFDESLFNRDTGLLENAIHIANNITFTINNVPYVVNYHYTMIYKNILTKGQNEKTDNFAIIFTCNELKLDITLTISPLKNDFGKYSLYFRNAESLFSINHKYRSFDEIVFLDRFTQLHYEGYVPIKQLATAQTKTDFLRVGYNRYTSCYNGQTSTRGVYDIDTLVRIGLFVQMIMNNTHIPEYIQSS